MYNAGRGLERTAIFSNFTTWPSRQKLGNRSANGSRRGFLKDLGDVFTGYWAPLPCAFWRHGFHEQKPQKARMVVMFTSGARFELCRVTPAAGARSPVNSGPRLVRAPLHGTLKAGTVLFPHVHCCLLCLIHGGHVSFHIVTAGVYWCWVFLSLRSLVAA